MGIEREIEDIVRTLMMRMTPRPLLYFDIEIVEHCNLNCKGCGSLSALAEEEFLDPAEYEKDLKQLSKLAMGEMHHINILGGEPLLHPDVCEFLKLSRTYFPHGTIRLITNGILVLQKGGKFWNNMRDNDIVLAPTCYPISVDYECIRKKAEEEGVKFNFFTIKNGETSWVHTVLDTSGQRNEVHSFLHCWQANNCSVLDHGKIYPCPVIPNIRHFNKSFNMDLYVSERDGIDIYSVDSLEEIMFFLSKAVPFCRYCNTFQNHPCAWGRTEKKIGEWT